MTRTRILQFFAMSMALALFIAACGSSTTTGSGPYGVSGGQTPSSTQSTPTSSGSSSSAAIKVVTMTVSGKSVNALTNAQGMTLYYNTSDTATSVCSGSCASAWPPFLSTSVPSVTASLPGTLNLLTDANGSQVTYNGHPLYTFSGDTASGQTKGEGVGGIWHVAPTSLATSSGSSSGGYSGGYSGGGYGR